VTRWLIAHASPLSAWRAASGSIFILCAIFTASATAWSGRLCSCSDGAELLDDLAAFSAATGGGPLAEAVGTQDGRQVIESFSH